jgi:hypothetical protein
MPPVYQSHFLTPRFVTDLRTPVHAILENISKFFATERLMVVMYLIVFIYKDFWQLAPCLQNRS